MAENKEDYSKADGIVPVLQDRCLSVFFTDCKKEAL
jgi:hypothetical protein